jgi:hypothetical protein
MNGWIIRAAVVVLLAGTGSSLTPARAADSTTEALLACADEQDDARRLRCFDAAVADLRKASKVPAVPAAAAAAPAAGVGTPKPAAAAPATSAATVTAEDRFGARGDIKPDKHEEVSAITATVSSVGTKPYGELVVTLDNGQVWAEIARNSKLKLKTGDTVTIERGALGSFLLVAPGGRSSKVARVR